MSRIYYEKMAQDVMGRFLLGAMERAAAFSMDMFARLSILEGAAGVNPGTWLRHGARGFGGALEHFGPSLAVAWSTTRNEGVYDKALSAASRTLGDHTQMGPEDLVQNLVVNSTRNSGPATSRIFYTVGEKLLSHKTDLGRGSVTPRDSAVMGAIERWVRQAAIAELRKSRSKKTKSLEEAAGPRYQTSVPQPAAPVLDDEKRQLLMLLALQSPGGPGRELRRVIDTLVDQSFPTKSRRVVKMFLQKISEPKYRSPAKMRQMINTFTPERWLGQTVNIIRREIMSELGVTAQYLTNVLGSKGRNIFKFMRERVGKNRTVMSILDSLAQDINILEPGISRVGMDREHELTEDQTPLSPHEVMMEWLRQSESDEKESSNTLPKQEPLQDFLRDNFERNEHMEWGHRLQDPGGHHPGAVELRLARRFLMGKVELLAKQAPTFEEWAASEPFTHPITRNEVKFKSLPPREQASERARWNQRNQAQEAAKKPGQWRGIPQAESAAFRNWMGEQGGQTKKKWDAPGKTPARQEIWNDFKKDQTQAQTPSKPSQHSNRKPPKGPKIDSPEEVEKFLSTPPGERTQKRIRDDKGNTFDASVRVEGDPDIRQSRIENASRIRGNPTLENSTVSEGSTVEGDAKLSKTHVTNRARVRGDTELNNAQVRGGSWDGQKITDGQGGIFHDAYDQETLDALTSIKQRRGTGDAPLQVMAHYFADNGRTKGWFGLGGDLDRKQLQKKIKEHTYDHYDRQDPWLGRGASVLDEFSDEAFDAIRKSAEKVGDEWKDRRKSSSQGKRMLYELTKAAFVHTDLRGDLLPLIRLGREARIASRDVDLRGLAIRTAYASSNPDLRRVILEAITASGAVGHAKQATRRSGYRPAFLRWVKNRKFPNPNPDGRLNDLVFNSLPSENQAKIYQEWQKSLLDWAQRHKPEGLTEETRITADNFDDVRIGDVIWRSDSPVMLHKVTKIDRDGWRANNPTLTMVQFDRNNPEETGEDRHLIRSSTGNKMLEYHQVPGMGARADRERAQARLPQKPEGGWPKFEDIGVGESKREKLQEAFKAMKDITNPDEVSLARIKARLQEALGEEAPRKVVKEFMHELRDWTKELANAARAGGAPLERQEQVYQAMKLKLDHGVSRIDDLDRRDRRDRGDTKRRLTPDMDWMSETMKSHWDAEAREKMKPVYTNALQEIVRGTEVDAAFVKKLVKKFKATGVNMERSLPAMALVAISRFVNKIKDREGVTGSEQRKLTDAQHNVSRELVRMLRDDRDSAEEDRERKQRREDSPGQHQDRRELRGGGHKAMTAKAKLNGFFIGKILPMGASDEVKAKAKEQLKQATYEDLERMRKAATHILDNWDSDFAQNHALIKHLGYDREGLKKLQKLIKRKLGDVNGRRYHDDVLEMSNKYDLDSEDADALYDWRVDKPARGRALSDQEKFNRFMAKAKPETKERMQGMDLADFMIMYKTILKEVLEDEEEIAEAA